MSTARPLSSLADDQQRRAEPALAQGWAPLPTADGASMLAAGAGACCLHLRRQLLRRRPRSCCNRGLEPGVLHHLHSGQPVAGVLRKALVDEVTRSLHARMQVGKGRACRLGSRAWRGAARQIQRRAMLCLVRPCCAMLCLVQRRACCAW